MMSRENSPYLHHLSLNLYAFFLILLLKILKVFADVKSGGNFCHNLGVRDRKECLAYSTVLSRNREMQLL